MFGNLVTGSDMKLRMPSRQSTTNNRIGGTGLRMAQAEKLMRIILPPPFYRSAV